MKSIKCGFSRIFLLSFILFSTPVLAQIPVSENGKFANINGAKIYYEEFGQGDPLILLHGFGRTLEDWKPFIPEYSKYFRVIAWDMRGHGRSTNPDTSNVFLHTTAAKDLIGLIETLGLKKVKAIGHSSGGILLLTSATINSELFEAIIPVSAQLYFSNQVRDFIRTNARPEDYYKFNDLEEQHGLVKGRILARQFYHFNELRGDPEISPEKVKNIKTRALIVHGDNDFVPVDQAFDMYHGIANAHIWIVPNGWHMPHIGPANSIDFIRISREFLTGEWNRQQ